MLWIWKDTEETTIGKASEIKAEILAEIIKVAEEMRNILIIE